MKSYQPYPAYRDSGVEWLGQIPEHWEVIRLKYSCSINPNREKTNVPIDDVEVSFLPMESIGIGTVNLSQTKKLADVNKGFTHFIDDDVIVAKITPCFENGKGAIVRNLFNGTGYGTTELHVLRVNNNLDNRFLYYITASYSFRKIAEGEMQGTAGQKRVTEQFVRNFPILISPISEQRAIADFLDRETARIDALIAKYQRLIELLEEKRASLVSQAVTKGLDASVEMKDSGVEWLGNIPSHWSKSQLKYHASFINGAPFKPDEWEVEGIPIIRIENLNGGEDFHYSKALLAPRYLVKNKDLLFGWSGNRGTSFGPYIWGKNGMYYLNQHIFRVCNFIFNKNYFYWLLKGVTHYVESQAHGIIGLVHITKKDLGNIVIPIIPYTEQQEIANFLDSYTSKIDSIKCKINNLIIKLQEYRTALISAAVTGKIDVSH